MGAALCASAATIDCCQMKHAPAATMQMAKDMPCHDMATHAKSDNCNCHCLKLPPYVGSIAPLGASLGAAYHAIATLAPPHSPVVVKVVLNPPRFS